MERTTPWHRASKDDVRGAITQDIDRLENNQADMFERFYWLAFFYDPLGPMGRVVMPDRYQSLVVENICAQDVDTTTAMIARSKFRAVFLPDQGDFSINRRAADMGRYAEAIDKTTRLSQELPRAFKDGATFGTSVMRWEIDDDGCLRFDRFTPECVRVNEMEGKNPRSMHLLAFKDREELMAKYPKFADQLEEEQSDTATIFWFGRQVEQSDRLLVRESYRLPIGTKGKEGYRPGRKVITTEHLTLLDEEYDLPMLPVAVLRWTERAAGFFGKGIVEELMGMQMVLNKQNNAMDVQIDMHAAPITYISTADLAQLAKMMYVDGVGRFVPISDTTMPPRIEIPKVIAPEVLARQEYIGRKHLELSGISTMHSHGESQLKRAETGAAVQEYNDMVSERFSIQEQAAERFFLDNIEVAFMLIAANARAGKKTPEFGYAFAHISKRIKWAQVDPKDITYQLQAAPQFSRTLSGRYQQIADWVNQGTISQDEARNLIAHPDLDTGMSLENSLKENIDRTADMLLDGEFIAPDPRLLAGLQMTWMIQHYTKAINDGAPEDRIENIRTWLDQAAYLIAKAAPPAAGPMGPAPAPGPAPQGAPMAA